MNKFYSLRILLLLVVVNLIFLGSAGWASAQGLVPCSGGSECDFNQVYELVNNILNFVVFALAVPLATIAIVMAGVWLVIYPGNEGKRKEAIHMMTTAVIGLFLVLAGYLIIKAIVFGLAGDNNEGLGQRLRAIFE